MDGSRVDWTNLPHQLPPLIAYCLQTHLEHLRIRSVCSSWRFSIPPLQNSSAPRVPIPLSEGPSAVLCPTTVYLLRPDPNSNPNPSASSSSTSSSKGWLLKLEESSGKLRLQNPITSWRIGSLSDGVPVNPMDLNLLDFNMVELARSYVLRYINGSGSVFGINKVIKSPNFKDYCSIFIIYNGGKLGFAKTGDQKLTLINDQVSDYDDMIVYKGHPFVVDKWGQIFCISSSLELTPVSPPIGAGHRKNLIECCGELYVVDRYSQEGGVGSVYNNHFLRRPLRRRRFYEEGQPKVVDFRVYKLLEDGAEELGRRWVEVKSLGEQAFFLSIDCCFSVLATELEGCKGNCIYFTDSNDIGLALRELIRRDGSVFSMEDRTIERLGSSRLYSKMFWPLPI
ncbi:F-box protein SKIP23 [Pyrus x bretschneideri]|uniref:F-box protein SKIP23 n=1 Tax=Pyrus x bretschneideri TaxID=225117 RepID=UPI0005113253|nr:F-box protein SKIP23 [Pyrus x bretschneideri]